MDAESIKAQWTTWYDKAPPLGHVMREQHAERWLRIHSLPGSRRYADSLADWAELLSRHNTVASEVLGEDERCVLFVSRFAPQGEHAPEPLRDEPGAIMALSPTLLGPVDERWPGAKALNQAPEDGTAWLHVAELSWHRSAYDDLLRTVANDEARGILLVSRATGRVYAPYDGGADLFFRTTEERDTARERYRAWLSAHPRGL